MKMCEERRNSATPGYCHSNASGDKDRGQATPGKCLREGERQGSAENTALGITRPEF